MHGEEEEEEEDTAMSERARRNEEEDDECLPSQVRELDWVGEGEMRESLPHLSHSQPFSPKPSPSLRVNEMGKTFQEPVVVGLISIYNTVP